ncbi:MAG TPA: zinc ABC transporter substrate-binding protein [Candidatus Saccharimonadales bacterium]
MIRKVFAGIILGTFVGAAIFMAVKNNPAMQSVDKLQVAVSFYPLEDFSRQIGGDKVRVINLTAPGAEPHDYEPPARDLAKAHKTAVFVYNGNNFEPWTTGFLQDYKGIAVRSGDGVKLLEGRDPHFWLDPVLAEKIVVTIRNGLIEADTVHQDIYKANADAYIAKLKTLDAEFRNGLASCEQRTIVSSHDAFGYLAQRYNFEVLPIAGISPEAEPAPDRLANLTTAIKDKGIRYVFFEGLVSPRLADTIARETGASTLVLDPIEGISNEDQKQGKDYIAVQRENLANLRRALACH